MSQFKAGQRVRVIFTKGVWPEAKGREATIVYIGNGADLCWIPDNAHWIAVDGLPRHGINGSTSWATPDQLSPLTDPGADAFIERIQKLKPYDEPKIVREDAGVVAWPK